MKCSDLMKSDVACVLDSSLVAEAARIMRDRGVGFLPVIDETGRGQGTITDRDIVVRCLAADRGADETSVAEVMTPELVTCLPDEDLGEAEDRMSRFQKSRIVCVDGQRHVIGVFSLSDVADAGGEGHAGNVLAAVASREARPRRGLASGEARTCQDIMRSDVECCGDSDGIVDCAARMRDRDVGFIPVCGQDGRVTGVVTDRDILVRVVAEGLEREARVRDAMSREVVTCSPQDSIADAEERMRSQHVSRLVCVDDARRPVGIVSMADIAQVERADRASDLLRDVSARREPTQELYL